MFLIDPSCADRTAPAFVTAEPCPGGSSRDICLKAPTSHERPGRLRRDLESQVWMHQEPFRLIDIDDGHGQVSTTSPARRPRWLAPAPSALLSPCSLRYKDRQVQSKATRRDAVAKPEAGTIPRIRGRCTNAPVFLLRLTTPDLHGQGAIASRRFRSGRVSVRA